MATVVRAPALFAARKSTCARASRASVQVRASASTERVDKSDKKSVVVSPSILSANFAKLGEEVRDASNARIGSRSGRGSVPEGRSLGMVSVALPSSLFPPPLPTSLSGPLSAACRRSLRMSFREAEWAPASTALLTPLPTHFPLSINFTCGFH